MLHNHATRKHHNNHHTAEAEARLAKANREYQSKHLTLRKRMLSVVATLGMYAVLSSHVHVNSISVFVSPR
jgi:hypothetical protein